MRRLSCLAACVLVLTASTAQADEPRELPLEKIQRGLSFTIRGPTQFVVARTAEQWASAWRLLQTDAEGNITQPPSWLERYPLPEIDLTRSMAVGIVLATHSDGCTGVTITGASLGEGRIVVRYRERRRRTDVIEGCATSFTTGFDFVAVPRSELPVVFREEEQVPAAPGQ